MLTNQLQQTCERSLQWTRRCSGGQTFLDGLQSGWWYYAVGSYRSWGCNDCFPSWSDDETRVVELYLWSRETSFEYTYVVFERGVRAWCRAQSAGLFFSRSITIIVTAIIRAFLLSRLRPTRRSNTDTFVPRLRLYTWCVKFTSNDDTISVTFDLVKCEDFT